MRGNAREIMEEAIGLCYFWRYIPIWKIEECIHHEGGLWVTDGVRAHIEVRFGAESGLIAHELFHSAYACSPLDKYSNQWVEGFCNAFAYFMEQPEGTDLYSDKPDVDLSGAEETKHGLMYHIPGNLILNKCNRNYGTFKNLWWRWNCDVERTGDTDYLDRLFSFRPGRGYNSNWNGYEI